MKPIELDKVQEILDGFINKDVYVHLETTNGAYASHINEKAYTVGAYIRNAKVKFNQAKLVGNGSAYRAGLKMDIGWIYAEGLTDWVMHEEDKLLMAGHDREGRLMVSLQISESPFNY
ncbi:YojF family protein [Oceanobacillus massiliensis]|uniref:YojF family protein n=1 Tax=Oceanobacillus massiliensis TaxID=1465765 RepID=UPI000289C1AD|nr:YojF family protein [Oceanobacillus massiliensis]